MKNEKTVSTFPFRGKKYFLLFPASIPYMLLVKLRNYLYDKEILKIRKLPFPVISIGNLTVGGTGKTPLVEYLASCILRAGKHPAILTRGYGGQNKGTILLQGTRDEQNISHLAVGDEALMLSSVLEGVPVVVDRNRYRGGCMAEAHFKPDTFILDDGMQHRQLHRDVELLVIDALGPFSNGLLLPAGGLREPLRGAGRADAIIISRSKRKDTAPYIVKKLHKYTGDLPVFSSDYRVAGFFRSSGRQDPVNLSGAGLIAFAGIGYPSLFFEELERRDMKILETHAFSDHYRYRQKDVDFLVNRLTAAGGDGLITTEKDFHRMKGLSPGDMPVYYMAVKATMHEENTFQSFLFSKLGKSRPCL